jgi:hypothetical protein
MAINCGILKNNFFVFSEYFEWNYLDTFLPVRKIQMFLESEETPVLF